MRHILSVLLVFVALIGFSQKKISQMDSVTILHDSIWFPVLDLSESVAADKNKRFSYFKLDSLLGTASGINISGTPANNQLAVWTDGNTIEGASNLTWDGAFLKFASGTGISSNTSDGADNQFVALGGGGTVNDNRGALFYLYGNEDTSFGGSAILNLGDVSGSSLLIQRNATTLASMNSSGLWALNSAHTLAISASNDIITKGYADANYGLGATWTTYSPTSITSSNVDSYTIDFAEYQSNSTLVKGSIKGSVNPTASGACDITISAPATAGIDDFCGVGRGVDTSLNQAIVSTTTTGTRLYIQFPSNTATGSVDFYVTFSYAK